VNYTKIIESVLNKSNKLIINSYNNQLQKELGKGAFGDNQYQIDIVADEAISSFIREQIPNCSIISEESGISHGKSNEPIVLIDPLDGSLNAVNKIPFFSSAIAIAKGENFSDIIATGVSNILTGDIYLANKNQSTRNNKLIKPSGITELNAATIGIDLNVRSNNAIKSYKNMQSIFQKTKSQRILGSAILENVFVASGNLDAYIAPSKQLRTFDCLPAIFIAKSSGAYVKFLENNEKINLFSENRVSYILAATKILGNAILKEIF